MTDGRPTGIGDGDIVAALAERDELRRRVVDLGRRTAEAERGLRLAIAASDRWQAQAQRDAREAREAREQAAALANRVAELEAEVERLRGREGPALDLDLLAKLASGEGGRRTGALIRAGFIEVRITEAGRRALGEGAR